MPDAATPRMVRYDVEVIKGGAVEVLMSDILKGILVIAKGKAVDKDQITRLERELAELKKVSPSLEEKTINHYGSGVQSVHTGSGAQNVNNSSGNMFSNSNFPGPVTFSAPGK